MKRKMKSVLFQNYNFKFIFLFFIMFNSFGYELQSYEKNIKNIYSIKNIVEKNSINSVDKLLRDFLFAAKPSRYFNTQGHFSARKFIQDFLGKLKANGVDVYEDHFSIDGKNGTNIIFEKKGIESTGVTIFCYYDTIIKDPSKKLSKVEMPGADNNATGVIISLMLAEIISKLDLKKNMRIVFLDLEELGNYGSQSYLTKYNLEMTSDIIILQSLGHDSKLTDKNKKTGNFKLYVNKLPSSGLIKNLENSSKAYPVLDFKIEEKIPDFGPANILKQYNKQLLIFSENLEDDLNPRLRTSNDFAETLNMSNFYNSYKYIVTFLLVNNYEMAK